MRASRFVKDVLNKELLNLANVANIGWFVIAKNYMLLLT